MIEPHRSGREGWRNKEGEAVPANRCLAAVCWLWRRAARSGLALGQLCLGLADGALLAQLGAAAGLARLLVILPLAQLLLDSASFQQLLEAAQGQPNRFSVMNAHPQRHSVLLPLL